MKPITMSTFQKPGLISILANTVSMLRFGMYPMVAMNYVDVEYPCFTITASNNGGNNNGGGNNSGNNTGGGNNTNNTCGNDPNLTDLMAYINPSAYVNSGFTYANYDINCTIPYTNYTLEVSLSNNTGYYSTNSWNWYETNNYEYIYEEWFNLNPGQYCVNATLWDVSNGAMNYVDGEYPCFTITASNNGGNNNGGGNNSMNGGGGQFRQQYWRRKQYQQ